MKLTICDRCGSVIESYNELRNTATIDDNNYQLCDYCVNQLTVGMKLIKTDNCNEIIKAINDLSNGK